MRVYVNEELEQGSVEWHALKWGKLTGSRAKTLMTNKKTEDTAFYYELKQEIEEKFKESDLDQFTSKAAERGNNFEPMAVEALEDKLDGIEFLEVGFILKEKHLGLSPDRMTKDLKIACEVKCPSGVVHLRYAEMDEIHPDHVWQAVHYFTVVDKLETLYWASYRPENLITPIHFLKIERDTLVNVGTLAKPVRKTVSEAVKQELKKYDDLIFKVYE